MPTTVWNLTHEDVEDLNSMLISPFHDLYVPDIMLDPKNREIYRKEKVKMEKEKSHKLKVNDG